jgi:NADPH:quinone reductase-like Zn-dependent oxidoreductase
VVIRVRATSFNYHDVFTVRGMPGIKVPMPMIIGLDLAGEILETGPGRERLEARRPRARQPAQQEERA